jgi:hypothetical protein
LQVGWEAQLGTRSASAGGLLLSGIGESFIPAHKAFRIQTQRKPTDIIYSDLSMPHVRIDLAYESECYQFSIGTLGYTFKHG